MSGSSTDEAGREFPIQNGPSIPWWLAKACYVRAGRIWHNPGGQSLERLAERGGWSRAELGRMLVGLDVMDDREPRDPSPLAQLLRRTRVLEEAAQGVIDAQLQPTIIPHIEAIHRLRASLAAVAVEDEPEGAERPLTRWADRLAAGTLAAPPPITEREADDEGD